MLNLASTRLAFLLIALLLVLIILSAIIPQDDFAKGQIVDLRETLGEQYEFVEKLGLNRIYYTPTFFIILGLLAVNLTAGNVKRFRAVYRSERTVFRLRHLGSIVFHLSLLLTMSGIILHFLYKYEGVFALTEGETGYDSHSSYFREFKGPLYTDAYENFYIKLESIGHTAGEVDSLGSKAIATLTPRHNQPIEAEIRSNYPLEWGEYEFHFGAAVGYSPELVLAESAGEMVFRSFIRVSRRKHEGIIRHFDYIVLPERKLRLEVEVQPPEANPDSVLYQVGVLRRDSVLYEGTLAAADTARFSGYELTVPRLRRWCYIGAIKNPYLNLIFTGFWLSLAGLTVSLVARITGNRN